MTTTHALTVGVLAGVLIVTVLVLPFLMWDVLTLQVADLTDDECTCGSGAVHHPSCSLREVVAR